MKILGSDYPLNQAALEELKVTPQNFLGHICPLLLLSEINPIISHKMEATLFKAPGR